MIPNKSRGYYFGNYDITTDKYPGADFSRKCFVFPGQGLASPGMFKQQYKDFKIIHDKFEKADSLAEKFKLPRVSDYIVRPANIKEDNLPIVRNLALFTMEVALHELLISQKNIPKIVTGHSFGEYAALVAAGVVSFEKMFDIVYHRDFFCPRANLLGFMIAISADENKTKNILGKTKFYVSNINSHMQTVISVSADEAEGIKLILAEKKIDYKVLSNIPQPYHSPYLKNVKNKIGKYLSENKIIFKKPRTPIFSSVIKKLIDENNFKEEDIQYILTNQIISPVNFIQQILSIYELRIFNFIELGEKRVFSSFIENILAGKEIKTDCISNILRREDEKTFRGLNSKNSKLFYLVSKTIGKITGYEIEKISFEDRYQEDLSIDSIKKADIILTVLNESKIKPGNNFNTSKFSSIRDTVNYLEKAEKDELSRSQAFLKKETCFGRYVFSWEEKLLDENFLMPENKGKQVLFDVEDIYTNKDLILNKLKQFFEDHDQCHNIIIKADYREFDYGKIILFFKFWRSWLKTIRTENFNLVLLSSGKISPSIRGYASFFKSMKKELPGMFFKHIHSAKKISEQSMLNIAEKELREPYGTDVLYDKGKRFTSVLKLADEEKNKSDFSEESVILAIGGAKGITFSLIKNISKKYKPIIYLIGRSSRENETVISGLRELKKNNSKIYYESLDACDLDSLDKLFSKIKKKHKRIDLIINGAGAVNISFIKDKTDEEMKHELRNKILPAFNILKLSLKYNPKKIINFSSIISKYGSAGQSIYTLANEVVNIFTMQHKSATVIHWPPWDGVGMTQRQGILRKLEESGVALIKPEEADKLFFYDLFSSESKSVYYMDKDDDLLYGFGLNNLDSYEPLVGKLTNNFNISISNPVFRKIFDLSKDIYLKDHQIKGTSYVPAAVGISMFLCLSRTYNKKFPILEKIVIHNPIIIKKEPLTCYLKAEKNADSYDFSIKSNVSHFSCQAKSGQEKRGAHYALNKAEHEILTDSIYSDYYFKNSLYQGPIFRCIDRALLDKDNNLFFKIDNSKLLPVLNCGIYDKLIQWIDVSFQALGAKGLQNNLRVIPTKVSKLTFFDSRISNYLYAIPFTKEFNSKITRGDVALVNEDGEAILEMQDVFLESINKADENKLKIVKYNDK